ncbi:helix-turn-helix domain-containing protein [Streptomyces longispororuber]|uniref:AraC-like ligand-binding domain-containing protein n=1 Tax=Streptomyces longispororuber TaxID=68230 RepID=UPI0036F4E57C
METVFDTAQLPGPLRVEAWIETTALALVRTDFALVDPDAFGARLNAASLGAMQVTEMSYGPLRSRRTPELIRQSDPEQYQIAYICRGYQGIEQVRRQSLLSPGELVLYDSSHPFTASVGAGQGLARSLMLQFPRQLLPLPESKVAGLFAEPLSGTHGVGRLFAQFLTTLADDHATYTRRDAARLGNTALDLATAVLAHQLDGEYARPMSAPGVLFLRITAHIDRQLHAPDLEPATIAAAHGISLRYLHRIFQQNGVSVSAYIKRRRLERCRRDLIDPGLSHLTVHAIGTRWGFPRPADFTRAFRSALGVPPTHYRAQYAPRPCDAPATR